MYSVMYLCVVVLLACAGIFLIGYGTAWHFDK